MIDREFERRTYMMPPVSLKEISQDVLLSSSLYENSFHELVDNISFCILKSGIR